MLGVCYYPEHWDESLWADDARRMAEMGLSYVRIGEFAWSALEPEPGRFDWGWMDRAVDTLAKAGLKIVMGTPTATPPKWLTDAHPEILPVDRAGRVRRHGSRRHTDFSSPAWRRETRRIVEAVAKRYGAHPGVVGWQTDNEYGCHDTVRSYSPAAASAFRSWLEARYGHVAALNAAWGARFWSQDYRSFGEIDPPNLTVTEPNPSHVLDWCRFSSDQVASYDAAQVEILRSHSPGRFVTHNFMGAFTDFDHWKLAAHLDCASWDSYPLGFTDSVPHLGLGDAEKRQWARTGHPDVSAFHHDLYRGVGRGRFWVMEQQPGPVNWAAWNPAPAPGMVRLWTWEALAHGAEVVSYFRWRQAPFAQEQMHAGLNRPDNVLAEGGREAAEVARELQSDWWRAAKDAPSEARAALVFDYETAWMHQIQPQGRSFDYVTLAFQWYGALRALGLDIDVVPPGADLARYSLVAVPSLAHVSEPALAAFRATQALCVFGPRSGAKTWSLQIPRELPPGPLQALLPVKVARVESLRPGVTETVRFGNATYEAERWREHLEGAAEPLAAFEDGSPAIVRAGRVVYAGCWPGAELRGALMTRLALEAGLDVQALPPGLRLRRRGGLTFAFNYGPAGVDLPHTGPLLLGTHHVAPHQVAVW